MVKVLCVTCPINIILTEQLQKKWGAAHGEAPVKAGDCRISGSQRSPDLQLSVDPVVFVQHRLCETAGHQLQLFRGRKPAYAEKKIRAVLL